MEYMQNAVVSPRHSRTLATCSKIFFASSNLPSASSVFAWPTVTSLSLRAAAILSVASVKYCSAFG